MFSHFSVYQQNKKNDKIPFIVIKQKVEDEHDGDDNINNNGSIILSRLPLFETGDAISIF